MEVSERDRLKKAAREEYDKKLAAIDLVYELAARIPSENGAAAQEAHEPKPAVKRLTARELLMGSINAHAGQNFNLHDALGWLGTVLTKPTIKATMRQLVREGFIEIVQPGSGRRMGIYRRKQ